MLVILFRARKFSALRLAILVSLLGAVLGFAPSAAAMTFEMAPAQGGCVARVCVLATGEIGPSSAAEFQAFVRKQKVPRGAVVVLNSQGGDVLAALALGGQIRNAGLATAVQAYDRAAARFVHGGDCASACAFVFIGGVERTVADGARVGVHQMYPRVRMADDDTISDMQFLTALVALHIDRMGAGTGMLVLALRTSRQDMRWLSAAELGRFGVITPEVTIALAAD
jgi:hypothetical protein